LKKAQIPAEPDSGATLFVNNSHFPKIFMKIKKIILFMYKKLYIKKYIHRFIFPTILVKTFGSPKVTCNLTLLRYMYMAGRSAEPLTLHVGKK
jgi:hypothetical protein